MTKNMKTIILTLISFVLITSLSSACPCPGRSGSSSRSVSSGLARVTYGNFSTSPGEYLLQIELGNTVGHGVPVTLNIKEDDSDIKKLPDVSAVSLALNERALTPIRNKGLFSAKEDIVFDSLTIGDWISVPEQRIELAEIKNLPTHAKGFSICGISPNKASESHKYEISIIGGFKRDLSALEFIPEEDVKSGDLYIVEMVQLCENRVLQNIKLYSVCGDDTLNSSTYYYLINGNKIKIEKTLTPIDSKDTTNKKQHTIVTTRISTKNGVEELTTLKYKKYKDSYDRVALNGRIRRDASTLNTDNFTEDRIDQGYNINYFDARGNTVKSKTYNKSIFLGQDKNSFKFRGKAESEYASDGSWKLFEYNDILDGDFRIISSIEPKKINDISKNGKVGIEDLKNIRVLIEETSNTDWQGSRHTKSKKKYKAVATYNPSIADKGYKLALTNIEYISGEEYEHIRNDDGGMTEQISVREATPDGTVLEKYSVGAVYPTLSMTVPIETYTVQNGEKTLSVNDVSNVTLVDSGFISNGVPNYSNTPHLEAGTSANQIRFTLQGNHATNSANVPLPWGGSYTAENFQLISGKSQLWVQVFLNYSTSMLYQAKYIYINGSFVIQDWIYYDIDATTIPYYQKGRHNANGTYATTSNIDDNNIVSLTETDGSLYRIGYSDPTMQTEVFRRYIGMNNSINGNIFDRIRVFSQDASGNISCGCGEQRLALGPNVESHFLSNQIGGNGGVSSSDSLQYQLYDYNLTDSVKLLTVDAYGLAIRYSYDEQSNSYTIKTIRPGYTESEPFMTETFSNNNERLSLTGPGELNQHVTIGENETTTIYGAENSGNFLTKKFDSSGNLIQEISPLGTVSHTYSPTGLLTETSNIDSTRTIYEYDSTGEMTVTKKVSSQESGSVQLEKTELSDNYEVTDNVLWKASSFKIYAGNSTNYTEYKTLTREFGLGLELDENRPVSSHTINIQDKTKEETVVSIDRANKTKYVKTYTYTKHENTWKLSNRETLKYISSILMERISESINSDNSVGIYKKYVYVYGTDATLSKVFVYNSQNALKQEIRLFYEASTTSTIEDPDGNPLILKHKGRASGITKISGEKQYGLKYVYYPNTSRNAGKINEIIYGATFDNDGKILSGKSKKYDYDARGNVSKVWGYQEIPTQYFRNEFGKITDIYTYKSSYENNENFSGSQWPSSYTTSHADVEHSQLSYDIAKDLLLTETDALGNQINYQYNSFGENIKIIQGNKQEVFHFNSLNQLISRTLSDDQFTYEYNSDGNVSKVSNTEEEEYSFLYNGNIYPNIETYPDGTRLIRTFDAAGNVISVLLKNSSEETLYTVSYTYHPDGRLSSMSAANKNIVYSDLMDTNEININLNSEASIYYKYDGLGNLEELNYKQGNTSLRKNIYSYTLDNVISDQELYIDGSIWGTWRFDYNSNLTGLTSAKLYDANSTTKLYDKFAEFLYEYDLSGNLTKKKTNSESSLYNTYTSNVGNQTTAINYASDYIIPIRGRVEGEDNLNLYIDNVLQNIESLRDGTYFTYPINGVSTPPKFIDVKIEAVKTTDTNVSEKTLLRGGIFKTSPTETLQYDNAGNLISDTRWNYVWNSRNLLASIETSSIAEQAGSPIKKFEFKYDNDGRKIEAKEYSGTSASGTRVWSLISTNKRYYDLYNLIYETTEYTDSSKQTEEKKYYYGRTLNGGIYESGTGVGGLRIVDINGVIGYVFNDVAGNIQAIYAANNISIGALNNSSVLPVGTLLAEYIYEPFGDIISSSGPLANLNPIRYSTQYYEQNIGLNSYLNRHYSPRLQKWITKDPLGTSEGVNPYLFLNNIPTSQVDYAGLSSETLPSCNAGTKKRNCVNGICEERTDTQGKAPTANGCGPADAWYSDFIPDGFPGYKGFGLRGFNIRDLILEFVPIPSAIDVATGETGLAINFLNACNNHDICYGSCDKNKDFCDSRFRIELLAECSKFKWRIFTKIKCIILAKVYHLAVSKGGGSAFDAAQDEHCKWEQCCEQ